jgi:hypothetical protein
VRKGLVDGQDIQSAAAPADAYAQLSLAVVMTHL